MRVTNNMIMSNTKSNINSNKVNLNSINNQMTTQKKIDKPSDDPVIAIRALRLRSSLSEINQYYEKNIPDAESWLDVTETSLIDMKKILTDIHTQCVNATTGTLTADDRNTILTQLKALSEQVYSEGDADYAGRTIFTGYKTNTTLTFQEDQTNTSYNISQNVASSELEEKTYSYNNITTPTTATITAGTGPADPSTATAKRMRLAYDDIAQLNSCSYSYQTAGGTTTTVNLTPTTMTTSDLEAAGYVVGDDAVVFNSDTGELLFGKNVASAINTNSATVSVNYDKTGFDSGELKPENYFDCVNTTDAANPITYTNYDADGNFISQNIDYTIASNQTLTINTQASSVFDSSIGRDVDELISSVQSAIAAHDMVDEITAMQKESQYSSDADQETLATWLTAAQKQADYADEDMQNLYSDGITDFSNYMSKVNLALTDVGSKGNRLDITKTRMANQQETVESLKSSNEDKELSDIVIDYTAAYTAYKASLQAASKVEKQTLLDYI